MLMRCRKRSFLKGLTSRQKSKAISPLKNCNRLNLLDKQKLPLVQILSMRPPFCGLLSFLFGSLQLRQIEGRHTKAHHLCFALFASQSQQAATTEDSFSSRTFSDKSDGAARTKLGMSSSSCPRTPDSELHLAARHPDRQTFLDMNEVESVRVRTLYKDTCSLNVSYGDDPTQRMDIFPSLMADSPILVFIHGGYWRSLDKKSYSFVAEPFVAKNVTVAVINYRLIPTVDMENLLKDVKDAVEFICRHASKYNGNASRIALSGHSAGGHLALMTYLMSPSLRPSIQAICSLSGIFDLSPIRHSYLSDETLQLTKEDVEQFSASSKDLSVVTCPTLIAVGGGETNFFIQESKKIANRDDNSFQYHEYDKLNHYQIVHLLGAFHDDDVMVPFLLKNLLGD